MLHCIFKEHKIHDGVQLIVRLEGFFQDLVEGLPGGHCKVSGLPDSLGKVAVDQWLRSQSITIQLLRKSEWSNKSSLIISQPSSLGITEGNREVV